MINQILKSRITYKNFIKFNSYNQFSPNLRQSKRIYRSALSTFTEASVSASNTKEAVISEVSKHSLYFDNVYPLRIGIFDLRHYIVRTNRKRLETKVKSGKWVPQETEMPFNFKIEGVEPRKREGGMFVNFTFLVNPARKSEALNEIYKNIKAYISTKSIVPWFNLKQLEVYLVKGEPFIEDLTNRFPASRLRIEFQGPDISIENLYKIFRPYGLIRDIIIPQSSSKDASRFALIQFSKMRSATSARNCVHGLITNGTRLNIVYDKPLKSNMIYNWMITHPRISVPLIAAAIAGITYTIFDPIRIFFITSKITQRFNLQEYRIYQWLRRETIDRLLTYRNKSDDLDNSLSDLGNWVEREQEEIKLKNWLKEPPETFIVLLGPTGSGKSGFIDKALQDKRNKIFIKCDEIQNSRDESELVLKLAKQVGYFPVFSILVSMSNLIDGLASATIGQKTVGFSSTTDSEIKKILDALAIALHDIAPENLRKSSRYNQKKKSHHDFITTPIVESYDPADIPIVVIDAYMTKDKESHELWDHLGKLAAILVDNRVAHVVFISSNVGIVKHLNKALPNKTFNFANLTDAPYERAIGLVKRHVPGNEDKELYEAVGALGGRLTDLKLFINKISSGQSPREALNELIFKSVIEIRKLGFGDDVEDAKTIPWSDIQFWKIMKDLAKGKSVSYDKIKYSSIFKGDDTPIRAMEQAELISISQLDGRPDFIRFGKPLYQAAFQQIISDKLFAATMELQTYKYLFEFETNKIKKCEQELEGLGQLFVKQEGKWLFGSGRVPATVDQRVKFLLELIQKSHVRTVDYEKNIEELKKFIASGGTS